MMEGNLTLALHLLPKAFMETLYMTAGATFFSLLLGLPLGLLLFVTSKGQFKQSPKTYRILGGIIDMCRSFPFAILIIALIPFTRFLVGTSLGTTASIIPLSIAGAFYMARVMESSLFSVDKGVIEAATACGSTPLEVIYKVLLPDRYPVLILQVTVVSVNLVGYTAMAGLVGGGGLGAVAMQYGYQRFNGVIMVWTILLLILLVMGIQWLGNRWGLCILKKRGLA